MNKINILTGMRGRLSILLEQNTAQLTMTNLSTLTLRFLKNLGNHFYLKIILLNSLHKKIE